MPFCGPRMKMPVAKASVAAADGATTVTLRQRSCGNPVFGLRRW